MNVHTSPLQSAILAISFASILVQAVTLLVFAKRKMMRAEFPIFFRYTAYCVGAGLLSLITYLMDCECWWDRPYLYWACTGMMICLQFGVMYESFVNALKPYSALIDLGKMLFRWAAVFLLLAALLTGLAAQGTDGTRILTAENAVERILALMQTGLLLLFFAFERKLGLAWRSYSMAIALGLGISAATSLTSSYMSAHYPGLPGLSLFTKVVYLAIVTFWAVCFRQVEPARKNVLDSPARLIFQRWNEALLSHGYGQVATASTVESFLPGIEKTVDRVMARTIH